MLDLNNLPKQKHEDLCKIIDYVLVALFAVFFILSLFPYYSVEAKGTVESRGFETTTKEEDSWSLLGLIGFPYNHESVADWQEDMYKENKSTIKKNEGNGFDDIIATTTGKLGMSRTNEDGETVEYEPLAVPGITTKTISIKQIGGALFLIAFALIGIALLLLTKGIGRALYGIVWGIIGVLCFMFNYILNMATTFVRPAMLAIVIIVLVVSVVNFVFYALDNKSRNAYLRSVSAAYA